MPNNFNNKTGVTTRPPGAGSGSPSAGKRDSRSDLGYGRQTPKFHVDKVQSSAFPYIDEDNVELPEEEILDDDLLGVFLSKTGQDHTITDPAAVKGTSPFYFAAGNTKLYECFSDPDKILREVDVAARSMFPVPGAYKKRGPSDQSGASFPHGVGSSRKTGDEEGFASPPPEVDSILLEPEDDDPVFDIRDIISDDERALKNARTTRSSVGRKNKLSWEA